MGCDIHGWIEKNVNGKFIAVDRLTADDRDYRRFALLAGVRDYNKESLAHPLGVPDNVSESAGYDIETWSSDGHSHSYISIKDAAKIFSETSCREVNFPEYTFFNVDPDDENEIDKYRLVFWFDN